MLGIGKAPEVLGTREIEQCLLEGLGYQVTGEEAWIITRGKAIDQRYHDYFMDEGKFHWQSQNKTSPESKRGSELISHESKGITVHLFVRDNKLAGGKASSFKYYGLLRYLSHQGSQPISITWEILGS